MHLAAGPQIFRVPPVPSSSHHSSAVDSKHSKPIMLLLFLLLSHLQRHLALLQINRLDIIRCLHTLTSNLCQLEVATTLLWSDEDSEDDAECDNGGCYTHDWAVGWSDLNSS